MIKLIHTHICISTYFGLKPQFKDFLHFTDIDCFNVK